MRLDESEVNKRHRERIMPWHHKAIRMASAKLADARAHAESAVTETLKKTPDGRASIALIRSNPSYKAALNRLDELWVAIAGPSVTSLNGLIHDVAEACYRDAVEFWRERTPKKFQSPDRGITASQVQYVRGLLWYGKTICDAFEPVIMRAKSDLAAAIGAAGSADRDNLALKTWETKQQSVIAKRIDLAINDADQRSDLQAMRDVFDPAIQSKRSKREPIEHRP